MYKLYCCLVVCMYTAVWWYVCVMLSGDMDVYCCLVVCMCNAVWWYVCVMLSGGMYV